MTSTTGGRGSDLPFDRILPHGGDLNLLHYVEVVVRRRGIVLATLGLIVVLAAILTLLTTPIYKATTSLQIERRGPEILNYKDVLDVDPGYFGYQDFYQTQYKIMRSRAVLRLAAERLDLANRPEYAKRKSPPIARMVAWLTSAFSSGRPATGAETGSAPNRHSGFLASNLTIQPVRGSHLVRISFTERDPLLARDSANAVAAAYQQFSLELRYSATAQASEFLTKQVAQVQAEIDQKERQLLEYTTQKEILSLRDDTQDITSQALAELNTEYVEAKARLAIAEARYESVGNGSPDSLAEVLKSPLINHLRQQYAEIERRRSQMAERFGEDWPALKQLSSELAQAGESIELETQNVVQQVYGVAASEHRQAAAEVRSLRRRVDEQKLEVRRTNRDAVEIEGLRAEISTAREFLDDLASRQSQTAVSDRLRDTAASNIRVVDPAETPQYPVKPNRLLNLLLATFLGLAGGIGLAFLVDHLDNTIKNEHDVERLVGIPVVGLIPLRPGLRSATAGPPRWDPVGLASHLDSRSPFAEAFKNLRTSLLLASPEHPPRHILVTSSEAEDGKSTVAVNLAVVLTQMGRRVLLVDADLRRPRLHRTFGIMNETGLSSVLTGNAKLEEVLRESGVAGLDLVTSGPIPPSPSELLGSPALESLLARASESGEFDHVILDSPPATQLADGVILASRMDTTLIVVRASKTARDSLNQGAQRLRRARAHITGAVLNGVQERPGYYSVAYEQAAEPENEESRGSAASSWRRRRRRRHVAGS